MYRQPFLDSEYAGLLERDAIVCREWGRVINAFDDVHDTALKSRISVWLLAGYVGAYIVGAYLGQWPTLAPGLTATLWIPSGLTLAMLILNERTQWPLIITVGFVTDVALEISIYGFAPLAAGAIGLGNLIEPLAGATVVLLLCGNSFSLQRFEDVLILAVAAGLVSPMISATAGALTLQITGVQDFGPAWLLWLLGDGLGVIIVAPLIIAFQQTDMRIIRWSAVRSIEATALIIGLITTLHLWLTGTIPVTVMTLPVLLWAGLRFGVEGATTASAMLAAMTFAYIGAGHHPFNDRYLTAYERTVIVQIVLGIASVSTLLLASLHQQVVRSVSQLKLLNLELENRVLHKRKALIASEQRARHIMDNQLSFVAQLDLDGSVRDCNQSALKAAGLHASQVIGKKFWDCYWGSYDCQIQARLMDAIGRAASGEIVRYDEIFRVADDERIVVDFMIAPIRAADGAIDYLLPSGVDITARKKIETELAEKKQRLKLALESAGAVDWTWDISNDKIYWSSDSFQRFFGQNAIPPSSSREWLEGLHINDRIHLQRRLEHVFVERHDNVWREQFRMTKADSDTVWLESFGLIKRDDAGRPQSMSGLFIDVTERRNAEFQLRLHQVSQAKLSRAGALGEYSSAIAHEINQPLMAARVYLRLAMSEVAEGSPITGGLHNALVQIDRAGEVIRRLREFIHSGGINRSRVNLRSIIRSTLRSLQPELERAQVSVTENIPDDASFVCADPFQVELVFMNLLRNSIDAIAINNTISGKVAISAAIREDKGTEVWVDDNGPGFAIPEIPKPFATTKPDGFGLGLQLSKSIIESHGGRIWVEAVTTGASVHFILPTSDEEAACRKQTKSH